MPPKEATHKEHNIYLITSVTFDNKHDDFGRLQVYQAFSSLDEANEFCQAKADELACHFGVECPDFSLKHYTKEGTFKIDLPLADRARDVTVETTIIPLMGGVVVHNKPVSRKPAKPAKILPQKKKPKIEQQEDDHVEADSSKPSSDSTTVTAADILAAPSGTSTCLSYHTFYVHGTFDHWSAEQVELMLELFGADVVKELPVAGTKQQNNFSVVLGSNATAAVLSKIKQNDFSTYKLKNLVRMIEVYKDMPDVISKEDVAKHCKQAKGKSIDKKMKRVKAKKEVYSDEDEEDEDMDE
jgi:hypothetical protein